MSVVSSFAPSIKDRKHIEASTTFKIMLYDGIQGVSIRARKMSSSMSLDLEPAECVLARVEGAFGTRCRIAETDAFLDALLPVETSVVDAIFERMKQRGYYVNNRWSAFPNEPLPECRPDREDVLFPAFVEVAEAIRDAALSVSMGTDTSDRLGATQWVDYHTATSMTTNRYAVPTRPDCLLSLPSLKGVDANVNPAIWWLQIIAAVEIKRCDDDSWVKVVQQLIGYLRRVLCQQMDRRFVFGLTLGLDKVTVWLHDRSGVLGTATSIDIHAQPQKFIQIIAAFAVLPAAKLGFDPSMKLYASPNCVKPSYLHDLADIVKLRERPQDPQWVIELNDGKQYLTVFALSMARAQEMHGLGTIAWVVVPYGHSMNGEEQPDQGQDPTQRQVFVLKQSWRRVDSDNEGNLYNAARGTNSTAPEFVGRILLCEDVLYGSNRDETSTLIRQNLGIDSPTFTVAGTKRSRSEAYIHIDTTEQKEISSIWLREGASEAISRVRTRVLMSTYGWPIDNFASMKELVRGITDAIKGHKQLYENGVLHRDISPGNIIMGWHPGHEITDADSRGCLIDLSHAKQGQKQLVDDILPFAEEIIDSDYGDSSPGGISPENLHQTMVLFVGLNVRRSAMRRDIKDAKLFHPEHLPAAIYEQARLIMSQGAASTYVKGALLHALKFRHLVPGNTCSEDVLGWHQVKRSYNYNTAGNPSQQDLVSTNAIVYYNNMAGNPSRTGTPPYISYEILSGLCYYSNTSIDFSDTRSQASVYHDATHDLESFFWVLVHICLTQDGPGGRPRNELVCDLDELNDAQELKKCENIRRVISCMFDSHLNDLMKNKQHLFERPRDFRTHFLANFHPYFDPLKPFISEWFALLRLAYAYHAYEYHSIHDRVLQILDSAQESISSLLEPAPGRVEEVLQARRDDINRIKAAMDQVAVLQNTSQVGASDTSSQTALGGSKITRATPESPSPSPSPKRARIA